MFPFPELNRTKLISFQDRVKNVLDFLYTQGKEDQIRTMQALVISFQKLESLHDYNLRGKCFLDCMADGAEACIMAHLLEDFSCLTSIELSEESKDIAEQIISSNALLNNHNINFEVGRLQDYFRSDADIVFLDTIHIGCYLDEGILLHSFFQCCNGLLGGSVLIIVSQYSMIDYEKSRFLLLQNECICDKFPDKGYLWILKVIC